jgi:hypothetical protein
MTFMQQKGSLTVANEGFDFRSLSLKALTTCLMVPRPCNIGRESTEMKAPWLAIFNPFAVGLGRKA